MIKNSKAMPAGRQVILGIETSCDETAAAISIKDGDRVILLSNIVSSSLELQSKYGGIVPEQAAREQVKCIIPVISEALIQAKIKPEDLDAIAVTQGPGLIGSLLIGVEVAKTLSLVWKKPIIPINHLIAHFSANWITDNNPPTFPSIGLLVSGGHTDIILMKNHHEYEYLGGTLDDAAGECFDKCARLLGLPYPGGPQISKLAVNGDPKKYKFPRPMINSKNLNMSFSGLKTAVANLVNGLELQGVTAKRDPSVDRSGLVRPRGRTWDTELAGPQVIADLAASIEQAIIDLLVKKTLTAAYKYNIEHIIISGGVAANPKLRRTLQDKFHGRVFIPPHQLCTDNAAMISAAAHFISTQIPPFELQADPNLEL